MKKQIVKPYSPSQKSKAQRKTRSSRGLRTGNCESFNFILEPSCSILSSDDFKKIEIARNGLPYSMIENLSEALNKPVISVLDILGVAQTTYNTNKKKDNALSSSSSELIILIMDLVNYGIEVFNKENDKFLLWLNTSNVMLRNNTPLSLLDTTIGVNEVKLCLDRIEYGNFA
mgnify:CR=1 FL=1